LGNLHILGQREKVEKETKLKAIRKKSKIGKCVERLERVG
jgi:hypothetical protein